MSRKLKNIIIILLIVILGIASGFTIKLAKESNKSTESGMMQGQQGQPPQMQSGDNQTNSVGDNQSTPPAKPDEGQGSSDSQDNSVNQGGSQGNNSGAPMADGAGQTNSVGNNQGTPPAKPDESQGQNGQMPSMPNQEMQGQSEAIDVVYYILFGIEAFVISVLIAYLLTSKFSKIHLSEIFKQGKLVIIFVVITIILTAGLTFTQIYITSKISENTNQAPGQMQMPGGGSSANVTYTASKEITEDATINGGEYSSTKSDENALLASGDVKVNISNATITKTGDSDGGDNSNFYGNNSAVIAKDGANLTLSNLNVKTDASGANGVFSYGGSATTNNSSSDGTTVTISDSTITTTGDNAGGIMTTGGGTTNATNLTINTSGTSSAAIRSDRGGGTVNVDKGTYTTTGKGSPTVYSTANITVKNANLEAKASEGIVIEGANTVEIENCKLVDSNTQLNGQSTTYKNIFLYQSMSGDASNGTATFTAKNSNITTNNGDTFYITNTTATINLTGNTIVNNDTAGNFLRAQKDSWGNSGSNGGNVTLKMTKQTATGNIVIDSISTLDMEMSESSYYEGTINGENSAKSIALKLDSTSKIKLTGDSYVTSLDDADTTYSNIDFNGYKLYVNGTAIN